MNLRFPPVIEPIEQIESIITPRDFPELAQQVMDWCDELAGISATEHGISRFYMTREHMTCNQLVQTWMQQGGMTTWVDQAGNVCGRYFGKTANEFQTEEEIKTLLIGSHLDSIPNAGKYDGILGVLLAIAAIQYFHQQKKVFNYHIDIIGFGDEEGTRFGSTLLGSRAVANTWQSDWWSLEDKEHISLDQAFHDVGFDPAKVELASRAKDNLLGYLEVHIEQGPVLEQHDRALGIVTAIAGARRFEVELTGYAGHSGTVPMDMRQDALVGAANAILTIEQVAKDYSVVATVGRIESKPGAVNVIPGKVIFSMDIRSDYDDMRDMAVKEIQGKVEAICHARNLTSQWTEVHNASAVKCARWMQDLQVKVLANMDLPPVKLMSGAGHDAMAIAEITDVAMYFVRCKGGVSHHPDELIYVEDVDLALQGLVNTLIELEVHTSN
ncbi:allantoate amidohydrolase [Paraglaciecola sp.]|uniref:allantoate amidohydrolase n=1 Tax=Paraglaciecola sp. TaxID=1920173 RepID=UPI003EF53745